MTEAILAAVGLASFVLGAVLGQRAWFGYLNACDRLDAARFRP